MDEKLFEVPLQDALQELDRVASRIESAWGGSERLRREVGPELSAKFEAQRELLDQALAAGADKRAAKAATAMRRGWLALDAEARRGGALPPAEAVFVGEHPAGFRVVLYQPGASLGDLPRDHVRMHVDEAIKLLPPAVLKVKKEFQRRGIGSTVGKVTDDIPEGGDEIPF